MYLWYGDSEPEATHLQISCVVLQTQPVPSQAPFPMVKGSWEAGRKIRMPAPVLAYFPPFWWHSRIGRLQIKGFSQCALRMPPFCYYYTLEYWQQIGTGRDFCTCLRGNSCWYRLPPKCCIQRALWVAQNIWDGMFLKRRKEPLFCSQGSPNKYGSGICHTHLKNKATEHKCPGWDHAR